MKRKITKSRIISYLVVIITLFTSIISLSATTPEVDDITDNWELRLDIYDSNVDDGNTPLTETELYPKDITSSELTVKITYKNTNAVKTYQPGELQIRLDDPFAISEHPSISIAADKASSTNKQYKWSYTYVESSIDKETNKVKQGYYIFTNNEVIGDKNNFDGSFELKTAISGYYLISDQSITSTAVLSYGDDTLSSNSISISSKVDEATYTLKKTASKITSMDRLPAGDYIWVKYSYTLDESYGLPATMGKSYFRETFPEGCIVLDKNFNIQTLSEDNTYSLIEQPASQGNRIYVGYPASLYKGKIITSTTYYYGKHTLCEDYESGMGEINGIYQSSSTWTFNYDLIPEKFLAEASAELNMDDFIFVYEGELYGIEKTAGSDPEISAEPIRKNAAMSYFLVKPLAIYTGTPMTVKIGDDILGISDSTGFRKLTDEEYYFDSVSYGDLYNGQNAGIPEGTYECELWIRRAGNTEYELYKTFMNLGRDNRRKITFSAYEKVVGWYMLIKDMQESLSGSTSYSTTVRWNIPDAKDTGALYNFDYIQVYFKDATGNLVLQNEPELDSYVTEATQLNIAQYDISTYGTYMQRAFAKREYDTNIITLESSKSFSRYQTNNADQRYESTMNISVGIDATETSAQKIHKFGMYDLLPLGMELDLEKDELKQHIINNANSSDCYSWIRTSSGKTFSSVDEYISFIEPYLTVEYIENYKGTNRTFISVIVDLGNDYLDITYSPKTTGTIDERTLLNANNLPVYITFDNYFEYGKTYQNNVNSFIESSEDTRINISVSTTAVADSYDFDDDGNIYERFHKTTATINILSAVESYQNVQVQVQTAYNNFTTEIADSPCSSDYTYKLKVSTGTTEVTNLILYSNIEEAQPERNRWKGEFLGIDTTYATNQGYVIKTWYSEKTDAGNLSEDSSWMKYTSTTDNSKVKSIAFQYLDSSGNAAILPENTHTYILIEMKSPADESISTLSRMDCWTEWNAIDDFGETIDFIIGVNSNVVKVALPNSVKTDDIPTVTLKFTKEIIGSNSNFDNMLLNESDEQIFKIRLTNLSANNDGTYNQITGLLSSTQGLVISNISIGTYLIEELDDNYFDFVSFIDNNDSEIIIENVSLEHTSQGYLLTINDSLSETIEFHIKVTNKIESDRHFEDKESRENLFLENKLT